MPDYQRMYAPLCKAIDEVIDPLSEIPAATKYAQALQTALQDAEEIYIDTSPSGMSDNVKAEIIDIRGRSNSKS